MWIHYYPLPWMPISNLQLNYLGGLCYTQPQPDAAVLSPPHNQGWEGWGAGSLPKHCQAPRYSSFSTWSGNTSFKRQWLFAERVKSERSELCCAAQPREITACLSVQRWRMPLTETTAKLVESSSIHHNVCSFLPKAGKMMINTAWPY